ncbi:uncharacterized protein LOC107982226 isoform X1 [Nasonia vitripennis]|uniref:Odorant receptor n=1 Tax=Nasonia vitripennis TaxID=7425 RepID=A0A7M7M877_NASVI|nr:uncharacterized protein LOC107982226 isoform X1 [Nasonia vitripennis]XP_031777249.1 uncharacterized protein LOC107982226 isoform X1 [Nasonia vitripennis]
MQNNGNFFLEARSAINITIGYGIPVYGLFFGVTFMPRIFNKKSLEQCLRSFPYYFKLIVIDENTCDLQVCVHFALAILFSSFAFLTISSTYIISVKHICGLYGIACHRLRNAELVLDNKSLDALKKSSEDYDTTVIHSLIKVIDVHKEALRGIQIIEKHYSFGFFFLEIGAFVVLAILMFEINYHKEHISELLRFLPLLLLFTTYVFFMNWCGEQVIQSCDDPRISVYNMDWYRTSSRIRIFVLMIMQRTTKPVHLTAGTVMLLSIKNFATILKTASSFGMLLLTTQKPGKNKDADYLGY